MNGIIGGEPMMPIVLFKVFFGMHKLKKILRLTSLVLSAILTMLKIVEILLKLLRK